MTAYRGATVMSETRIENRHSVERVQAEAKVQAQRADHLRPIVDQQTRERDELLARLRVLEPELSKNVAALAHADTQARDLGRMAAYFARENNIALVSAVEPELKRTSEWAPVDPATTVLPSVQEQPPANLPAWASGPDAAAKLDGFLRDQAAEEDESGEPADDKRGDDEDPPATGGDTEQADDKPENGGKVRKAISEFVARWWNHPGRRIAAAVTT